MYTTQPNAADNLKRFFREGSALANLIIFNIAVWVLVQAFRIIFFLYNQPDAAIATTAIIRIFGVPASLPSLLNKPWTLITYMFLHIDVWHVLFNMLWLYWFGKIFVEFMGNKKLVLVYFLGGISGALVYILAFNFFPVFSAALPQSYALGASASVMAIVTAAAFKVPDYTVYLLFFGRIRIIYMAIALFVFDFFMIPTGNAGGHIAHIGGAMFGFLYIQLFANAGSRWFDWQHSGRSRFRGTTSWNETYENPRRPVSDEDYNVSKIQKQKKMDDILDKISKGGYDSLTKEEKEFLFKSSGKRL